MSEALKEKSRIPMVEVVYVFRAELSNVYPLEEYWDIESVSGRSKKIMIDFHQKMRLVETIKDLIYKEKLGDKIYRHERIIK